MPPVSLTITMPLIACLMACCQAAAAPATSAPGWAPGSVPGVVVSLSKGQVLERPTAPEDSLVLRDLWPEHPFVAPLEPASVADFRRFYAGIGPGFETMREKVRQVRDLATSLSGYHEQVDALIARGERWIGTDLPGFEPAIPNTDGAPGAPAQWGPTRDTLAAMRLDCALAYALSDNEAFAVRAWEAALALVSHFYTHGVLSRPYPSHSPWDCAEEVFDAAICHSLIARWEGLAPLDHALIYAYLRRMGQRVAYAVQQSPVIGHQQAVWTCNLGLLALGVEGIPEAPRWRKVVEARLPGVMADFMTDGGHIEACPALHVTALEHVARYGALAVQRDPGFAARNWGRTQVTLEKAFRWLTMLATPLGEMPGINAGPTTPLATVNCLRDAINEYHRGDWLHAARLDTSLLSVITPVDRRIPPRDPNFTSVLLPDSGFAVLRDNWSEDSAYLLLDWGRHGGEYGHADKLNIILYANGQPWVPDAGETPGLEAPWYRGTLAHNTVLLDDQSQSPTDGEPVAFHTRPEFDIAAAEHSGYAACCHRRTVFHPRGRYFLIIDELQNASESARQAEWVLHVDGLRESGTRGRYVFRRDGQGLCVMPGLGAGMRGSRIAQGPCALHSPDGVSSEARMIPYIALAKAVPPTQTAILCVAIIPFTGDEPELSVELSETPTAVFAQVSYDDTRDRFVVRRRGAPEGIHRGLGLATDGAYAFDSEVGREERVLDYVDGSTLSLRAGR